jgi:hypothetical protein
MAPANWLSQLSLTDGRNFVLGRVGFRDNHPKTFPGDQIAAPTGIGFSHELRDQTARLVHLGFAMMRGGYRRLLLRPISPSQIVRSDASVG